jgi:hypothetical protein
VLRLPVVFYLAVTFISHSSVSLQFCQLHAVPTVVAELVFAFLTFFLRFRLCPFWRYARFRRYWDGFVLALKNSTVPLMFYLGRYVEIEALLELLKAQSLQHGLLNKRCSVLMASFMSVNYWVQAGFTVQNFKVPAS